jgi:hypothetical protein
MRPNFVRVIPGRGCVWRVVGFALSILPDRPTVRNCGVSRSGLERPVVEGESPVDENIATVVVDTQVAAGP